MFSRIIVSELKLQESDKSVPSRTKLLGGIAGGHKFIVHGRKGLLFKVAQDRQVGEGTDYFYGGGAVPDHESAAKTAANELRGASAVQAILLSAGPSCVLRVPLMALSHVSGFTVLTMVLLPLGPNTLVMGSADAGATVRSPEGFAHVERDSAMLGRELHVLPHLVAGTRDGGVAHRLNLAGDCEGHVGTDGRTYLVDLGRVLPPQSRSAHLPTSARDYLFRQLRPEMLQYLRASRPDLPPLNPDALSNWCLADPDHQAHCEAVRAATKVLVEEVAVGFAHWLERFMFAKGRSAREAVEIGLEAHRRGINCCHLGLVRSKVAASSAAADELLLDMHRRSLKQMLRAWLRDVVGQPYKVRIVTATLLNLVVGSADPDDCATFWRANVDRVRGYFGEAAARESAEEQRSRLRLQMHRIVPYILARSSLVLTQHCLDEVAGRFEGFTFHPLHVSEGEVFVKSMSTLAYFEGALLEREARRRLVDTAPPQSGAAAQASGAAGALGAGGGEAKSAAQLMILASDHYRDYMAAAPSSAHAMELHSLCLAEAYRLAHNAPAEDRVLVGYGRALVRSKLLTPRAVHDLLQTVVRELLRSWAARRQNNEYFHCGGASSRSVMLAVHKFLGHFRYFHLYDEKDPDRVQQEASLAGPASGGGGGGGGGGRVVGDAKGNAGAGEYAASRRTQRRLADRARKLQHAGGGGGGKGDHEVAGGAKDPSAKLCDGCQQLSESMQGSWKARRSTCSLAFRALIGLDAGVWGPLLRQQQFLTDFVRSEVGIPEEVSRSPAAQATLRQLLKFALDGGHSWLVAIVSEMGLDLNGPVPDDPRGATPLGRYAAEGHAPAVRLLLGAGGVDAWKVDRELKSPAARASEEGHAEVVRLILGAPPPESVLAPDDAGVGLRRGASAPDEQQPQQQGRFSRDADGMTLLMLAAAAGRADVVNLLVVEFGFSVQDVDSCGRSALHHAAARGQTECVAALLDHGSAPNALDFAHASAMELAIAGSLGGRASHLETIRVLAARGVPLRAPNSRGFCALHVAAEVGSLEAVSLMVELGLPVNVETASGMQAVHVAVNCRRVDVVRLLVVSLGADPTATAVLSKRNVTPLIMAALIGAEDCIRALVELGCGPDSTATSDSRTALHLSTSAGVDRSVHVLLELGADPRLPDNEGADALHLAAAANRAACAQMLLDDPRTQIEAVDRTSHTALHVAASHSSAAVARVLVGGGANVSAKGPRSREPLHLACDRGHLGTVRELLDGGANVAAAESQGLTPAHLAAWRGNAQVLELLLERGAPANVADTHGDLPLHLAARTNRPACVKLLLSRGADAAARNRRGRTARDVALKQEAAGVVAVFAEAGVVAEDLAAGDKGKEADNDDEGEEDGLGEELPAAAAEDDGRDAPVHADDGDEPSELLPAGGAASVSPPEGDDVIRGSPFRQTTLFEAARSGSADLCRFAVSLGDVNVNGRRGGRTALSVAAGSGEEAVVRQLAELGADPLVTDADGSLPLHVAAGNGLSHIARLLVEMAPGSVNARTANGRTALYVAALANRPEMVRVLAGAGADPLVADQHGRTALHFCALHSVPEVVRCLLEVGASVSARDSFGQTPLHYAAKGGRKELVAILVAAGSDVNAVDDRGRSVLMAAASDGRRDAVAALLKAGATGAQRALKHIAPRPESGAKAAVVALLQASASDCQA